MILRLSLTTAALIGENAAEWQLFETQIRAGRRTTADRAEEWKLRALAAELGVQVREEGMVPWRRRPRAPHA